MEVQEIEQKQIKHRHGGAFIGRILQEDDNMLQVEITGVSQGSLPPRPIGTKFWLYKPHCTVIDLTD